MAQTLPNVAQYLSLSCRREPRDQTRDPSCGGSWNRNPSQGITWIRDGSGDSGYQVEGKTTGSGESGWGWAPWVPGLAAGSLGQERGGGRQARRTPGADAGAGAGGRTRQGRDGGEHRATGHGTRETGPGEATGSAWECKLVRACHWGGRWVLPAPSALLGCWGAPVGPWRRGWSPRGPAVTRTRLPLLAPWSRSIETDIAFPRCVSLRLLAATVATYYSSRPNKQPSPRSSHVLGQVAAAVRAICAKLHAYTDFLSGTETSTGTDNSLSPKLTRNSHPSKSHLAPMPFSHPMPLSRTPGSPLEDPLKEVVGITGGWQAGRGSGREDPWALALRCALWSASWGVRALGTCQCR
ncbi:hypothetical protein EDB80DRAFT_837432 [Ilyonectria destructans]|nr:hypothetical protein EDB80DRAFT_837432 [Ilyonectria destructans]